MKYYSTILLFLITSILGAQQTVGLFQNDSLSLNGYTLISNTNASDTYLIDNCGEVVNSWTNSSFRAGPVVYLLDDGSLLKTCKLLSGSLIAGGSGGRLERYDWNDSLIWEYDFDSPTERQHHDINVLPNGNILVLSWDVRTRAEAISAGLDTTLHNLEIWSEKVVEITPIGSDSAAIVWEWFLWDHLIQDINSSANNFGNISQNRQLVDINYFNNNSRNTDYFHANGMDYNPDLDQIIISVRNYDEFWIIDHSTTSAEAATNSGGNTGMGGDILYRWGNPETYQQGTIADKKLFGQHNPNWIPKGYRDEGKIMVFNNGFNDPNLISKVQIIVPPIQPNGTYTYIASTSFDPDTAEWEYEMPVYVDFVSGAVRLENGNTFITSGPDGHLYELDARDSIVWEYISPLQTGNTIASQGNVVSGNTMFRAYKYSDFSPAFQNRTITPLGPLELNPLPSTCVIYPSIATNITEIFIEELQIEAYPNPVSDQLTLKKLTNDPIQVSVFDIRGKLIWNEMWYHSFQYIDFNNWPQGTYILTFETNDTFITKKIIK